MEEGQSHDSDNNDDDDEEESSDEDDEESMMYINASYLKVRHQHIY